MYIHVQKLILNDEASAAFYTEIEIFETTYKQSIALKQSVQIQNKLYVSFWLSAYE